MFSFFKRQSDNLILAALLLVPAVWFLSSGHKGRDPNLLDRGVLALASPVQSAFSWLFHGAEGGVSGYVALKGAHQQAQQCSTELSSTRAELNSLLEEKAENARLKAMLGYTETTVDPEIPARVIGLNPTSQFLSLRINKGEADGVRAGMPVITADGVVGQVVRAVGGSADVLLVSDPGSRVGAVVQRSRVRGNVVGAGDGKSLGLDNVGRDADVVSGDAVLTSGTDGLFPKGLVLGRVEQVRHGTTGLFLTASVAPAVNLRRVEEVMVVPVHNLSSALFDEHKEGR